MPGPEDLVVDDHLAPARLLVSSVDRTDARKNGAIFAVELQPQRRVQKLAIDWRGPVRRFRPHGIALLPGEPPRLFVINHGFEVGADEAIEVFDVEGTTLRRRETITGGGLVRPNDLAVRRPKDGGQDDYELFVSNAPRDAWGLLWEWVIGPHSSFVARLRSHEPRSTRIYGFRYANGVAIQPDNRLYVASSLDERVFAVAPDGVPDGIVRAIEIDSLADNLTTEQDGTMLVAASGSAVGFARHAAAAMKGKKPPLLPTFVWRIAPGPPAKTTLLFEDSGSLISGGSSAVCVGSNLYIGQVFDDYVLEVKDVCGKAKP